MAYYRDERAAKRQPPLLAVRSQDVDEGYRLVSPDSTLTPVVEHVQWVDNHPAGPDTHVVISFEDGTSLEFPFGVPLTACWYAEQRHVGPDELAVMAPDRWGGPVTPWA